MSNIVLDISRTISRIEKGRLTGIDRVEAAYIEHLLNTSDEVYFLARFSRGVMVFDRSAMVRVRQLITQVDAVGKLGLRDRILRTSPIQRLLRDYATKEAPLIKALQDTISGDFIYLNVGHGRMDSSVYTKLRMAGAKKIIAMIHDVIPLDFPEFCKEKTTVTFRENLKALMQNVDVFIYNSTDTANRTRSWMRRWNIPKMQGHVVLLGTKPLSRERETQQECHPYFVVLGTIEPRKNHRLLLDIWAGFHDTLLPSNIPHLHIIGARGWMNETVFHTLDTADFVGGTVLEHGHLSDAELGTLLSNANALLFPSFAEGFGYPMVEALQLGVPVICSDLACFHEIAGTMPTYISTENQSAWADAIMLRSTQNRKPVKNKKVSKLPSWATHFHNIDTIISDMLKND